MKTFLTLIVLLTFTFSVQAKDNKVVELPTIKVELKKTKGEEVVRVHKNKNYKVIKALKFSTNKKSVIA